MALAIPASSAKNIRYQAHESSNYWGVAISVRSVTASFWNYEYLLPYALPASQGQAFFQITQSVWTDWNKDLADLAAYQEKLKRAILKYGTVVTACMRTIRRTTAYIPASTAMRKYSNHAAALVGWDDTKVLDYYGH